MTIAAAGHVCVDLIPLWTEGSVQSLQPGKMVVSDAMQVTTGGAMSNTGGALARLGQKPIVIGKVGCDELGSMTMSVLEKVHAPERLWIHRIENSASSYTVVLSPPDADRLFIHYPGPNATFHWSDVPYERLVNEAVTIFHFGYPPLMDSMYQDDGVNLADMFRRLQNEKIVTSLDTAYPDPASAAAAHDWQPWLERVLPLTDLFLPSLDELLVMLKQERPCELSVEYLQSLAGKLHGLGAGVVGIKLGEDGFFLSCSPEKLEAHHSATLRTWAGWKGLMPCFEVTNRGATGAGDTAIAGLLTGLEKGYSAKNALVLAAAVAACCVEAVSAIDGIPSLADVEARIAENWETRNSMVNCSDWVQNNEIGLFEPGEC